MSAGVSSIACAPVCQGFLKKRKDKMRLRWATYWFKLYNGTLFFYNRKRGGTSDLRGLYDLIAVDSVRELTQTKKKYYSFEIAMKNGKRKVLAAESADLRQQWMYKLLQAIGSCVYNTTELNSNSEIAPYYESIKSGPCSTLSISELETSDRRRSTEPESYQWSLSKCSAALIPTATSLIYIDFDRRQSESSQCHVADEVLQNSEEKTLGNDYDVLPCCKPLQTEEAVYDTPPSNRRVSERECETEHIYDVPKYAFRNVSQRICSTELPELTGLLRDMVICLGGNSSDWVKATAPGTICAP